MTKTETEKRAEAANRLEEIWENLEGLIREAHAAIKELDYDDPARERARRTWLANLETAKDKDHSWLGREHTLQDTIDELRAVE